MGIIYKNGIAYGNQPSTDAVAMIEPSEEASATSAHAYAVGEHFIYNNTLYRATAAIAIGDTITPGTNCVATNVMTEVESGGGGGGSEKLNSTQAADAYDPTATYAVGDKVSYAGNVYSCISAISTPEAWDSTHWDQVDPIQDQVDDVRNTLNQLGNSQNAVEDAIAYVQSGDTASWTYTEGQFVYLKNHPTLAEGLYKVNSGGIPQSTSVTGHLTADTYGGMNSLVPKYFSVSNSNFNASTSFQYTGVSIQIPAGYAAIISAKALYINSRPNSVAICGSSTNVNAQIANGSNFGVMANATAFHSTSTGATLYLWAKYDGTGINSVEMKGVYFPWVN